MNLSQKERILPPEHLEETFADILAKHLIKSSEIISKSKLLPFDVGDEKNVWPLVTSSDDPFVNYLDENIKNRLFAIEASNQLSFDSDDRNVL